MGMERVRAWGPGYNWDGPIREGYNAQLRGFSFRAANQRIAPVTK